MKTIAEHLIAEGQQIGWENGEKFELERGKKEMVLTMLSNGATVEMVSKLLGITEDEVREYMHVI